MTKWGVGLVARSEPWLFLGARRDKTCDGQGVWKFEGTTDTTRKDAGLSGDNGALDEW